MEILGVTNGMPTGPNHNDDDGPPDYFGIYLLSIEATIPAPLNNQGVFIASDLDGNEMIWATDGTVAGTTMLQPLPGEATFLAEGDQPNQDGQPDQYVADGKAFFQVSTDTDGTQLWVTDGTSGGTSMLQDFSDAPDLRFLGMVGGQYLFISSLPNDGTATLWASDGGGGGLVQLASMDSPTLENSVSVDGGAIVYEMGGSSTQLWQTDGTVAGTSELPVNNNSFLTNIGGYAIFDGGLQNATPVVFTANGTPNGTLQLTSPTGDWSMESGSPPTLIDDQPTAIEHQFLVAGSPDGGPVEPWIVSPASSVTVTGGLTLSGFQGITLSDQTLATFTDPNGDDALRSYSADIQWGDGGTSTASITGPNASGVFTVTGSHVYASDADSPFKISVVIHRPGSPDAGVNDTAKIVAPIAVSPGEDVYVIGSGTAAVSAANGVLANDTGGTGTLSVVAGTVRGAKGGTFAFNPDGSFTYTPPANFPGFDYATYTAKDADGDQNSATVNVLSQTGGVVWKFYEQVLHRDPDYAGLSSWINELNANGDQTGSIAAGFFDSTEAITPIITGYYEQYLGRAPDNSGLNHWIQVWQQTGAPEPIEANFLDSPEFNARAQSQYIGKGAGSVDWLWELYQAVLGRAPDAAGLNFWEQRLSPAGPLNEFQVALDFLTSPEDYNNDVTRWYGEYLGRAPTTAEQAYYAGQMQQGAADRDIEQAITSLAEYANNPPAAPAGTGVALPYYLPSTTKNSSQQAATAAKDVVFSSLGS